MKDFFKRFFTCSIAACLIAVTAFAGACTPNNSNGNGGEANEVHTDPTKSGYSITVLYPNGTPVKGSDGPSVKNKVSVQLVDASGKDIEGAGAALNDYGKVTINYKVSGEFLIDVYNCPNGYDYVEKVYTVENRGDYTVTLSAASISYTLTVKLPDGTPANGVKVNIKKAGETVATATTGNDGKAVLSDITADIYDLEFTNLPEGVSYIPTKLTPNDTKMTIELIYLKELKLDTMMSAEKLDEWDKLANSYDESAPVIRFNRTADCYDFETDVIPEGKKLYYYFTADKEGDYCFISRGKYYVVDFYGSTLNEVQHSTISEHTSGNTCEMVTLSLKVNERYYFSYSIPDRSSELYNDQKDEHELSGKREFMIAKPVAGAKRHVVNAPDKSSPTLNYTVDFETETAILVIDTPMPDNPNVVSTNYGGIFEICSHTNEYDVKIEYYPYFNGLTQTPESEDDDSGEGKNFKYILEVPPSHSGNKYYFKIIIKSKLDGGEIPYPDVEVPITITRTGDAEENFSPIVDQTATATEKYSEQSGTFHFLHDYNSSVTASTFNVIERDGGYYVNIDGTERELVVAITKNLKNLPYSYATIEYMGAGAVQPGGPNGNDEMPSTPSETKQNSYLILYTDPAKGEDKTNPRLNFAPFIEKYATLCNSNGVYKLNAELKVFLEMYYGQHWHDFADVLGFTNKSDCSWLISCGYYA